MNAGTAKNYELQSLEVGGSGQAIIGLRKTIAGFYALTLCFL